MKHPLIDLAEKSYEFAPVRESDVAQFYDPVTQTIPAHKRITAGVTKSGGWTTGITNTDVDEYDDDYDN